MVPALSHPFRIRLSSARALHFGAAILLGACDGGTGPPEAPSSPPEVVATAVGQHAVEVVWSEPGPEAETVEIERAEGSSFEPLTTLPATESRFVDTGLAAGTHYRYRIRLCNGGGCSPFSAAAAATTFDFLSIAIAVLPPAVLGRPYTESLHATGGDGEYVWEVVSGTLPPGLALSPEGIVSGIPDEEGVYRFTVRVESGDGGSDTRQVTIEVLAAEPLAVLTAALPPALEGGPYEVFLEAEGGTGSFEWSLAAGRLPRGLALDPGGVLFGAPTETGTFSFTLRIVSGPASELVEFELRIVADDPGSWNLTTFSLVPVPDPLLPAVAAALERWEEVIVADLGGGFLPPGTFRPGSCFGFGEAVNGTSVDDMIVILDIAPIDGPGQVLGQATPCLLQSEDPLPLVGVLTLDSGDLAPLVGTRMLVDLIFHEIGHTLGFGSQLWAPFLMGGGSVTPTFTGPRAVAEWQALGGAGDVPVEGAAGPGTNDAHWRESTFGTEVMTGFLNQGGNPLSRVTIASMGDLGYEVNLGAADPFVLPAAGPGAPARAPILGWDVVPREDLRRLMPGRSRR